MLLEQFENVLILILLVGAGLSAVLGHQTEAIVISVIVVFAALLGFVQEYRAERALEALRELAAPTATVVRGGRELDVPARELVPGDLVRLTAGDRVPADGRVCDAANLAVEEAALTGESVPVEKSTAALRGAALPIGDRTNMVYAGTAVSHGRGSVLVVATGSRTEFGAIARMLETIERRRTPLQQSLDRVGVVLARVALAVVVVIVSLGLLRGEPFLEMLVFGVAVAVAVVPEALPAVVTISLSLAAQRMARRNALVRRLAGGRDARQRLDDRQRQDRHAHGRPDDRPPHLGRRGRRSTSPAAATSPRASSSATAQPSPRRSRCASFSAPPRSLPTLGVRWRAADGSTEIRGDPTEAALVVAAAKAGIERDELVAGAPARRRDRVHLRSGSG